MALISPLHCCIMLILGCLICCCSAQANEGKLGKADDDAWHVVDVESLLPGSVCSSPSLEKDLNRLTITHRHGPCTRRHTNHKPTDTQILQQDQERVDSMHSYVTSAKKTTTGESESESLSVSFPAQSGVKYGTGNYVIKIGVGTPKRDFSVMFDTGSDLSWIQCKPCKVCYNQTDPIFDPSSSSTFSSVPCSSPECVQLDDSSCAGGQCRYEVRYGDNSQTDGLFARDTLTLSPTDTLPNFMFGCGTDNGGLFGETSGLLGLGRERVSLISQASSKYGARFSYCIPSRSSYTGYLTIGANSASNNKAGFTTMVQKDDTPSFYYVTLTGLKVGGQLLKISPTVFAAGTVIDSGTVITRLPPTAYAQLRARFRQIMKRYPSAPGLSILDTCYDFTRYRTVKIPIISFVFSDGTALNIDFTGVLYVAKVSQACLAFAANSRDSSIGIIGNTQQKTLEVVYDIANQKIGFGSGGCK